MTFGDLLKWFPAREEKVRAYFIRLVGRLYKNVGEDTLFSVEQLRDIQKLMMPLTTPEARECHLRMNQVLTAAANPKFISVQTAELIAEQV